MPNAYSKTNWQSRPFNEETNSGVVYAWSMSNDVTEIIGELLKITGISQEKLADIAGVSQSTVSKWGDGIHDPSKPAWDKVIAYAAGNEETAYLAHRYILSLLGGNSSHIAALVAAAFAKKAS